MIRLGRGIGCLMVWMVVLIQVTSAQMLDKASVVSEPLASGVSAIDTGGKRWALVVGIADYPSEAGGYAIQPLKAPVKDAEALTALLKDHRKEDLTQSMWSR